MGSTISKLNYAILNLPEDSDESFRYLHDLIQDEDDFVKEFSYYALSMLYYQGIYVEQDLELSILYAK